MIEMETSQKRTFDYDSVESLTGIVSVHPDRLGGEPCFAGTRVPLRNMFEYLEAGDSLDDFLEGFPTVSREQVVTFLEEARDRMLAAVR